MAAGRLASSYPRLVRAARSRAGVAATTRARGSFAPRHGKAVEPAASEAPRLRQTADAQAAAVAPKPAAVGAARASTGDAEGEQRRPEPRGAAAEPGAGVAPEAEPDGTTMTTTTTTGEASETDKARRGNMDEGDGQAATTTTTTTTNRRPLEAVLLTEPTQRLAQQHPQMAPPPYMHHFDSYSLVKQLQEGGYTPEQATTAMKGIRTLLAQNLDVAQQSLVSKSDVENETYLFTAACSELSTEIKNNRRLQDEQMRQQRTLLQHEVDILTQSLNQELLTLNDNVRGMFNDRKMAVREEQKTVESAIQKITYKMSILLSSDSKSEIEGVRWILIRRSVLGIIFMAMVTLGMLRYATYVGQQRKLDAERRQREHEELRKDGGKTDHSSPADAAAILAAS